MFGRKRKDAHNVPMRVGLFHFRSSPCDTKVEEDGQKTEATMVPATFTKHLVTITVNLTMTKRPEDHQCGTQGKEGEKAYNISRQWKVYNRNFRLILFEIPH